MLARLPLITPQGNQRCYRVYQQIYSSGPETKNIGTDWLRLGHCFGRRRHAHPRKRFEAVICKDVDPLAHEYQPPFFLSLKRSQSAV